MQETLRLRLVPVCEDHVPLLVELDSDPDVKRFVDGGKPSSIAEAERFVSSSIGHRWVALSRSTDEFVGWFGLVPSSATERELGYRLRRSHWGMGFATEGSVALRDYAFEVLGVDRVWAQTMSVNIASRRVLEGWAVVRSHVLRGLAGADRRQRSGRLGVRAVADRLERRSCHSDCSIGSAARAAQADIEWGGRQRGLGVAGSQRFAVRLAGRLFRVARMPTECRDLRPHVSPTRARLSARRCDGCERVCVDTPARFG